MNKTIKEPKHVSLDNMLEATKNLARKSLLGELMDEVDKKLRHRTLAYSDLCEKCVVLALLSDKK